MLGGDKYCEKGAGKREFVCVCFNINWVVRVNLIKKVTGKQRLGGVRKLAIWISDGRMFQAEKTASVKALEWYCTCKKARQIMDGEKQSLLLK